MVEGGMACACGETIKAKPADMASMLRAFELAMQHESIPKPTRERILNRLLYGTPYPAARQAIRDRPQSYPITGLTITERAPGRPVDRALLRMLDARSQREHAASQP